MTPIENGETADDGTRRAVRSAKADNDQDAEAAAHRAVDRVKRALGERGAVWWKDGAPDFNSHMANPPYAAWYAQVSRLAGKYQRSGES